MDLAVAGMTWVVGPVLLICFLSRTVLRSVRRVPAVRLGWACAALVFLGRLPGAPFREAFGAQLGGIAVVLALLAAIRNLLEERRGTARPGTVSSVSPVPPVSEKPADKA